MKRFAIDVVILPPETVVNLALKWNRELRKVSPTNLVLDNIHYRPHISLAMGCLAEDQLDRAKAILKSLATRHEVLELRAPSIKIAGNGVVAIDIDRSRELAEVHESIITLMKPLLTQDSVEEDINDIPPIEKSSIDWINHFIPDQCFQHFWPHITLGFGDTLTDFQPFSFQASHLAICHLGNHCTCTTILSEAMLRPTRLWN